MNPRFDCSAILSEITKKLIEIVLGRVLQLREQVRTRTQLFLIQIPVRTLRSSRKHNRTRTGCARVNKSNAQRFQPPSSFSSVKRHYHDKKPCELQTSYRKFIGIYMSCSILHKRKSRWLTADRTSDDAKWSNPISWFPFLFACDKPRRIITIKKLEGGSLQSLENHCFFWQRKFQQLCSRITDWMRNCKQWEKGPSTMINLSSDLIWFVLVGMTFRMSAENWHRMSQYIKVEISRPGW